jgi:DNA-binding NarL/FixJ family response regulator
MAAGLSFAPRRRIGGFALPLACEKPLDLAAPPDGRMKRVGVPFSPRRDRTLKPRSEPETSMAVRAQSPASGPGGAMGTGGSGRFSPALIVGNGVAIHRRLASLLSDVIGADARVVTVSRIDQARQCLAREPFALALIDIGLLDGGGIDLIVWLQAHYPDMTSVVVSASSHRDTLLAALNAGAISHLLREREVIELLLSLKSSHRSAAPVGRLIVRRILSLLRTASAPTATERPMGHHTAHAPHSNLSHRETEILQMLARGFSNREIAGLISLSHLTVEGYTKSIYRKLAVGSRTAAVFEAKVRGLLT